MTLAQDDSELFDLQIRDPRGVLPKLYSLALPKFDPVRPGSTLVYFEDI